MKKAIIPIYLFVILFTFNSCETDLSEFGNMNGLFGVVIDHNTHEPIPNATVYINGEIQANAISDANGNYRFEALKGGNYLVSAEHENYISSFQEISLSLGGMERLDIPMEYKSMLSTHYLDFGTDLEEMEIVVTNLLDRTIDVKTEEDAHWMFASSSIFGLQPGESGVINVSVHRFIMNDDSETAPLIINIEKDFDFDVLESYVVDVHATR